MVKNESTVAHCLTAPAACKIIIIIKNVIEVDHVKENMTSKSK